MLQLDDLQKRKEKCLEYLAQNVKEQEAIGNDINESAEDNKYVLVLHKNRTVELADQRDTSAIFFQERGVAEEKTAQRKERQAEGLAAKKQVRAQKRMKKKKKKKKKKKSEI
ncbi:hypothetical protein E8E11_007174 [Didymella keratinophila]|nr:hypothetical protein E8E11_007174 [Didymella keratinophila]